jgi:hypothetical protein
MLATFIVEIAMAIYVVWRYKLNVLARLSVALLFFLALFQISEYFVCGGAGLSAMHWSRVGFASITMLPPLGWHLMHVLAGIKGRQLVWAGYATAVGFIVYFLVYHGAITGNECTGNYVIFQLGSGASFFYALFYYGWIAVSIRLGMKCLKLTAEKRRKQAVKGLIAGYLVFLVPTSIAVVLDPAALRGIPSVMCGFAVIFAVMLTFFILPIAYRLKFKR